MPMLIRQYESSGSLTSESKMNKAQFLGLNLANIFFNIAQQVGLPLFEASLGPDSSVYFITLWYNLLFNCIAWPIVLFKYQYGSLTHKMIKYTKKHHYKLFLLGFFEAIYEILNWYASSLSRVSGSLQSILSSSVLPFTFILSHILLKKRYTTERLMGIVVSFLGILVSLIPDIYNFSSDSTHILWPIVFLLSDVFLVLTNITAERIFKECKGFDSIYILAWQTFYTLVTVLLFFWVDILPWFGSSENLSRMLERQLNGLVCFFTPWRSGFDECDYCMTTGVIYVFSYVMYCYVEAELIKQSKGQSVMIISAITPCLAVMFWLLFPGLNAWAQGKQYETLDIVCYIISLPIIVMGLMIAPSYSYYMYDMDIYIYYT
jgi:drug/metabolite transporter (DMT)-like permease